MILRGEKCAAMVCNRADTVWIAAVAQGFKARAWHYW